MTVLSEWPEEAVTEACQTDPLMERLRQVLYGLQRGGLVSGSDLLPLLRQALLRRATQNEHLPWVRVPMGSPWPAIADWGLSQFDVIEDASHAQVRARFPQLSFLEGQADLFDDAFRELPSRSEVCVLGDPVLVRNLPFDTYTGHGQREAARALLHLPRSQTLIVNLPTGSGKSLMAQLPPLLQQDGTMTLAIVPTVALAIDQAARMAKLLATRFPHRELPPLAYHSGLSEEDRVTVWRAIRSGSQPILFTSPESATGSLRILLEQAASAGRLDHVVIDEAHLVIGWGNGFRPAFQLLPAMTRSLRNRGSTRPLRVVLASATLTAATTEALRQLFGPPEQTYVVAAVHLRPEPRYAFQFCNHQQARTEHVLEAVRLAPRPLILYVTRPDEADAWVGNLRARGHYRLASFTGRTPSDRREALLKAWAANELDIMVATSAFGLGVDKSDVRTVIHATMPESLDRFYQEVGRAGRDGKAGISLLLYTHPDVDQARGMAGETLIGDDTGHERWTLMIDHAVPDPEHADVHWVDLTQLPPHLKVESDASAKWNIRTLTLMARAGLIQLIALRSDGTGDDNTPQDLSAATRAAIQILDDRHRHRDIFAARMRRARDQIWAASERGLTAMLAVAEQRTEVSAALKDTYSSTGPTWSPVSACCGGCPVHWTVRNASKDYAPPQPPRLASFAVRPVSDLRELGFHMVGRQLLVVDVPGDGAYDAVCIAIAEVLADYIRPHTWVVESTFAERFRKSLSEMLMRRAADDSFVDTASYQATDEWRGSEGETRVLLFGPDCTSVPEQLWLSNSHLDVLVIPSETPQTRHPSRRFIDTIPHIHAYDLLERLTA
ncbi:MAG: protein DpdF [Casimicrobiaceae bacterium]